LHIHIDKKPPHTTNKETTIKMIDMRERVELEIKKKECPP
jgi:hypothetical protein